MTGADDNRSALRTEEQAADGGTGNRFTTWLFRLEVWMVILISLSSVAIAWSAYQAHRWSGIQAENYELANAARTESVRASNRAHLQTAIDIDVFGEWLTAAADGNDRLADFLRKRFRDEFRPAFTAWRTSASADEDPEGTPFALPEYRLAAREASDRLQTEADSFFAEAKVAQQTSDNFVALGVLLAAVLFFGGISTQLRHVAAKVVTLSVGSALFVVAVVIEVWLPSRFGF